MTPEQRKAIAMSRITLPLSIPQAGICERFYPKCCNYHEGFDNALALLEPVGYHGAQGEGTKRTFVFKDAP